MSLRIFAATDLSAGADEAIRQADERARAANAPLAICHVLPRTAGAHPLFPQLNPQAPVGLPEELLENASEAVELRVAELTGRQPGEYELFLEEGAAHAVIVSRAEEWGADLVVVGSHGTTALHRMLIGNVADRVIRLAHGAVLVTRPPVTDGPVLVATDFSDPALPAVAAGVEESRRTGAPLVLLHSLEVEPGAVTALGESVGAGSAGVPQSVREGMHRAVRTMLEESLARFQAEGAAVVEDGPAAHAIVRAAESLRARLVVVGTSGHTGLKRLALGSVAEAVSHLAPCSVLAVRVKG